MVAYLDKDSEIARLNYLIADYHEAIGVLRESKDKEIAQQDLKLKDLTGRIKALDGWKRTNATYGSPGWSATASAFNEGIDRAIEVMHGNVPIPPESGNAILGSEPPKDEPEPIPCSNCKGTGVEHSIWSVGNSSGMSSGTCRVCKGTGQKPIPKEPELVICPKAQDCDIKGCMGQNPHEHTAFCDCKDPCSGCPSCIPYKKEPTVPQEPDRPCQACVEGLTSPCSKPLPGCPYEEPEPTETQQSQAAQIATLTGRVDASMAKDIGDLTLRMDKLEKDAEVLKDSFVTPHGIDIANTVTRVSQLETALKSLKEGVAALDKKVK